MLTEKLLRLACDGEEEENVMEAFMMVVMFCGSVKRIDAVKVVAEVLPMKGGALCLIQPPSKHLVVLRSQILLTPFEFSAFDSVTRNLPSRLSIPDLCARSYQM